MTWLSPNRVQSIQVWRDAKRSANFPDTESILQDDYCPWGDLRDLVDFLKGLKQGDPETIKLYIVELFF